MNLHIQGVFPSLLEARLTQVVEHFITLASSVNRNVNGGPVSQIRLSLEISEVKPHIYILLEVYIYMRSAGSDHSFRYWAGVYGILSWHG